MAKPPSDLSAVQELFERFPILRDLKLSRNVATACLFAAEMGQQGRATKSNRVWVITTPGVRKRKVTVKNIPASGASMHFSPIMLTSGEFAGWNMARSPATYDTQAEAAGAGRNDEQATALLGLDQLHSASEDLAEQVTAHADAVERRGDEIDGLLEQIRASMSATGVA